MKMKKMEKFQRREWNANVLVLILKVLKALCLIQVGKILVSPSVTNFVGKNYGRIVLLVDPSDFRSRLVQRL